MMQRHYNIHMNESDKNGDNGTSGSVVRAVMLFGALVLALALVLIPVGLKWANNSLMDNTQYANSQQSSAMTAIGSHHTAKSGEQ